jgi:hypothetical protein
MRPGAFSQRGFLGAHERLADVLARDAEEMRSIGVTFEQLGARLEEAIAAAESVRARRARVGDRLDVSVEVYRGFQMCPWSPAPDAHQCTAGGGVRFASLDWRIRNRRSGREMRGPGLAVHLIRDHHFFEGLESPYRIDPSALVGLLDLTPARSD